MIYMTQIFVTHHTFPNLGTFDKMYIENTRKDDVTKI